MLSIPPASSGTSPNAETTIRSIVAARQSASNVNLKFTRWPADEIALGTDPASYLQLARHVQSDSKSWLVAPADFQLVQRSARLALEVTPIGFGMHSERLLRDDHTLQVLLEQYADLAKQFPERKWFDRMAEEPGISRAQHSRLHGLLVANGWLDVNVSPDSFEGDCPKNCYRVTSDGVRALHQLASQLHAAQIA